MSGSLAHRRRLQVAARGAALQMMAAELSLARSRGLPTRGKPRFRSSRAATADLRYGSSVDVKAIILSITHAEWWRPRRHRR